MSQDDELDHLRQESQKLIEFYLKKSCPCAFVRFQFLVGFEGSNYSKSLLHLFESNALVLASIANPSFLVVDAEDRDLYHCAVCGNHYHFEYEEFSINFHLLRLVSEGSKVPKKGADVKFPIPLFMGIYLSNGLLTQDQITAELKRLEETFKSASLSEFINYMQETG